MSDRILINFLIGFSLLAASCFYTKDEKQSQLSICDCIGLNKKMRRDPLAPFNNGTRIRVRLHYGHKFLVCDEILDGISDSPEKTLEAIMCLDPEDYKE